MFQLKKLSRVLTMRVYLIFVYFLVNQLPTGRASQINCESKSFTLTCSLRTIDNTKALFESFSSFQIANLSSLQLICSDVLFFESFLEYTQHGNETSGFLSLFKKLTDLDIGYCKIRRVPARIFGDLKELKRLTLKTHNSDWSPMMMELVSESFSGLTELRHLDLSENNIWTLPSQVFCPLHNLKNLNLTTNRIQDIGELFSDPDKTSSSGSCNSAIEELDLSHNDVITVRGNFLSNLRSLTTLYLQENAISTIGHGALNGLSSLQVLNVSSNCLSTVPAQLFQACEDIKQIYFTNNSLNVLEQGLFDGLNQLQVLDLSNNELTSKWINKDTFSGLVRMIVLNLAHNLITRIDTDAFLNLYSLQILNLEHNQIDHIAENAFSELKNLHALTLSRNKLRTVESGHFSRLYVLNQLFLDHNNISFIHPKAFENVTNLEELIMNGNDIIHVPEAIKNLRSLKSLDLGENKITALINSSFVGLNNLYGIRLAGNKISKIFIGNFQDLPSLQVLNLASNKVNYIDEGSFDLSPALRAIRLDDNKLPKIFRIFNKLPSLVWLNLSSNELEQFRYEDIPIGLQWFNINSNRLIKLPVYPNIHQYRIKILDASYNMIETINKNVIPHTVEHIYLDNNKIKLVQPTTFIHLQNLVKVTLYRNAIRKMDIGALAINPVEDGRDVPDFYVSGNPFECDCSMEWLQRINQLSHTRRYGRVSDLEAATCSLVHSRGASKEAVHHLETSQFLCPYEAHCFALCHCCDFDACDCEMTCPKNCTCYHDLTWTANVVDCANAGYTEVPSRIPMDATEIYLDGNNLVDLGSHVFIGKKKLRILYLNNSNLHSVHNRTFIGVESLKVLHLEYNHLQELRGDEFDQLHNLNELYLNHNGISYVGNDTFNSMTNLEVLRLDENKIINFSPWQLLASSSGSLSHLSMEGNKWTCDCYNVVKLDSWLRQNPGDPEKMFCITNNQEKETISSVLNRCGSYMEDSLATSVKHRDIFYTEPTFIGHNYVSIFAATLIFVMLVCIIGAIIFAFRQDVRLWAHSRYGVRLFKNGTLSNIAEIDAERLYDAYLIYSIRDEDFAKKTIAHELEHTGFSVYMHYRDMRSLPATDRSAFLTSCISRNTEISKRIVVILTLNFLAFEWLDNDFRSSLLSILKNLRSSSKSKKIIFVLTTDVSTLNLDPDLQVYLRSHGVFYWGEKRFWDKFRFAMPDVLHDKARSLSSHSLKRPNYEYTPSSRLHSAEHCNRYHMSLPPPGSSRLTVPIDGAEGSNNWPPYLSTSRTARDMRERTYFV